MYEEFRDKYICIENISLFATDYKELKFLSKKFSYLDKLIVSLEQNQYSHFNFRFSTDVDPNYKRSFNINSNLKRNKIAIDSMRLCTHGKNDILRLHITLIAFKSQQLIGFDIHREVFVHSSQVIVNLKSKDPFMLESSILDTDSRQELENIKEESVEVFLQHYLDERITVSRLNLNVCQSVNLQGKSGLCQSWSLYLFLLYLKNPTLNRDRIYNIFGQYTQKERNIVILQFIYYIYSLNLTYIPECIYEKIPSRKIPII